MMLNCWGCASAYNQRISPNPNYSGQIKIYWVIAVTTQRVNVLIIKRVKWAALCFQLTKINMRKKKKTKGLWYLNQFRTDCYRCQRPQGWQRHSSTGKQCAGMFVLLSASLRRIHYLVEVVAGSQSGYCNNQQLWALLKAAIALNELQRNTGCWGNTPLAFPRAQERLKTRPEGESLSWFFLCYTSFKQLFPINCSEGLFKCQSEPMDFSITSDTRLYTNSYICN